MNIDTKIRHTTPPGANLFAELGFAPAEAAQFNAELHQQINQAQQLKLQLMQELANWIADSHLKQADAAGILMVSRPRVSDVVNMKTSKFTIDMLVNLLARAGKAVRLAVV
jgi:predicted XRE-type DNA-binding protein